MLLSMNMTMISVFEITYKYLKLYYIIHTFWTISFMFQLDNIFFNFWFLWFLVWILKHINFHQFQKKQLKIYFASTIICHFLYVCKAKVHTNISSMFFGQIFITIYDYIHMNLLYIVGIFETNGQFPIHSFLIEKQQYTCFLSKINYEFISTIYFVVLTILNPNTKMIAPCRDF
jgi:hypothetical protein